MQSGWQPASNAQVAKQRARLLARIRDYFHEQHVLEVDTPSLTPAPPADPNIENLKIEHSSAAPRPMFLHSSPEYAMKRLLAAGYPDIFSICRVFRDGEVGRHHQPEFTMLEWYRRDFDLDAIIADSVGLIEHVLHQQFDIVRLSYRDAFIRYCDLDPQSASLDEIRQQSDPTLQQSLGDNRDSWLDLLFSLHVAPCFDLNKLTVITHYPRSQAALARLDKHDETVAERFEVFLGDRELANGYVELQDVIEFVRRQQRDLEQRRNNGQPVNPVDQNFLAAMHHGLPQCAGVALGFERLHMIAAGAQHIRDVLTFEFER